MTKYESEPVKMWEYRNFKCGLYCLRIPDDSRWIGYVKIGDVWTDVVDENGIDPGSDDELMIEKVEDKVDQIIQNALSEDDINWPFDPPQDPGVTPSPLPGTGPDDDDVPFDPNPTWRNITYMSGATPSSVLHGSASVKTTSGGRTEISLANVDADDFTDDGLYKYL